MSASRASIAFALALFVALPALAQVQPIKKPVDTKPKIAPSNRPIINQRRNSSVQSESPLTWSAIRHDWGRIGDIAPVEFEFHFTNNYGQAVTIDSVRAGCGCTKPQVVDASGNRLDQSDLPVTFKPGESGRVWVQFNPQNRVGRQDKNVIVSYENIDPNVPNTQLLISSDVQPTIEVTPNKTFARNVRTGTESTTNIVVRGKTPDFMVTRVDINSEFVTAVIGEPKIVTVRGDQVREIPVEFVYAANIPIGRLNVGAQIFTNHPDKAVIPHNISGQIAGTVSVFPANLSLSQIDLGEPFAATFRITSTNGQPVQIENIEFSGPSNLSLVADFEPLNLEKAPSINVSMHGIGMNRSGAIRGDMIVSLVTGERVQVPFSGYVRTPVPSPLGK